MRNDCLLRGAVALLTDISLSGPGSASDSSAWRSPPGFSDSPSPQSIRLHSFSFSRNLISSSYHTSQYCLADHHGRFPGCGFALREQTPKRWQSCSSTFKQAGANFLRGQKNTGVTIGDSKGIQSLWPPEANMSLATRRCLQGGAL